MSPPSSSGAAADASGQSVDWINVTVTDQLRFSLTSSPLSASEMGPGDLVHVSVEQLGVDPHTFTLSPTPNYQFPTSDTACDLNSYFQSHPPLVNVQVDRTTPGSMSFGNFTAPPLGQYQYVCTDRATSRPCPGSSARGSRGPRFTVNNGPGAAVFIIVGVITSLVIIALVLGFVVGRRRGSEDEMSPERLGYPGGTRHRRGPRAAPNPLRSPLDLRVARAPTIV